MNLKQNFVAKVGKNLGMATESGPNLVDNDENQKLKYLHGSKLSKAN